MKNALALALAAGIGWPAWSAPSAQVELFADAVVNADMVVLGQVAHIRSTSLDLTRTLVNLRIGPAPRLGASATVSRQALEHWIRRQTGVDTSALEWTGGLESAIVTRASQLLPGERIADVAVSALRDRLAAQGQQTRIDVRSSPASVAVEPGDLSLQVRDIAGARIRPHMLLWVEVSVEGRGVRAIPVSLSVADLEPPLLQVRAGPAVGDGGTAAAGPHRRLQAALAVQRGESASLRETSGAVALESRVEVLQDGSIGDKVRVRATHSTGLMLARVVGPGLLEIAP